MAENFRNLKIWQMAEDLTIDLYVLTRKFPKEELFSLTDQIRRAGISVPANIAESSGRFGVKDKIQFLMIARGSIIEIRSHISIARRLKYISDADYAKIDSLYESLTRSLNAFIRTIRETPQPSSSFSSSAELTK
jgi:four helix bundle protein